MYKIGISGKANSGKNLLANTIFNEIIINKPQIREYKTKFMAFADPIKEMVLTMYPDADREHLFGQSNLRSQIIPNTNITYRQALLDIGKLGRSYDENIWVNNFEKRYNSFLKSLQRRNGAALKYPVFIVPDIRFINEVKFLKDNGFYLIRLVRPDNNIKIYDISETQQDWIIDNYFNQVIFNDKDISSLKNEVITKILLNLK